MSVFNQRIKFMSVKRRFLSATIFIVCFLTCSISGSPAFASEIDSFKDSKLYSNKSPQVRLGITEDRDALIKTIEIYIDNEQYTKAMLELNELLNAGSDNPRIYILSANLLRKTYQYNEAEQMAKKALELDYQNSGAYLALGYIYFEKAKFSANSSEAEVSPDIARDYLITGFDHFFMASQYAPDSPYPHIGLAEAYYTNKQEQRAKDEILKAKELAFSQPEAFYEIGRYYYKINDYDKAKKYIEKSVRAGRSKNYRAYYNMGRIAEQKGDLKEAQQLYLQTLRLKPDMLAAQKHLDALIKTSYKKKMSEQNTPKDLFANVSLDLNLLLKADYYLMIDELTKARDIYIKLLEKKPQNSGAAAGLAELYYSMWKEGFPGTNNFTNDAVYIIKAEESEKNKIALLKFRMINEAKIPENIRKKLINLSISDTFEFYDLLNEIRAEYLLGNYEECHNKLYNLINMNLSNYEKFKVLKSLCYDRNYYGALAVIDELRKTYYHSEEIEPAERRIISRINMLDEKIIEALNLWEEKQYDRALSIYLETMNYFPTYKSPYLHYGLAMRELENYEEAYSNLNFYYKLYKLYPDRQPEIKEEELKDLIRDLYKKTKKQIKKQSK